MGNVPRELIKTQSIAVRDLQIGCRGRENSKEAAYTMRKPEKMGPENGVCEQTAWSTRLELRPPGTCSGIPFNSHSPSNKVALAARSQESRKLEEMLKSWSHLGVEVNRLCVKTEHVWRGERLMGPHP